jgi:UDP-glucose 4-epimerase
MRPLSDFYQNRRVLVLGGLGFIGSNLALTLVESGADVTLVDSMLAGLGSNLFNIQPIRDRVRVNISDVRDSYSLPALVRGQDVIFSLAGQVSHVTSMQEPLADQEINCRSQLSLLECCRKHNPEAKIVFASTRQLYGRPRYLPVDERHPIAPVDVNGVSKHAAELYYALYHEVHGLRTVALRLTNTYGPRLNLRGTGQGFISVFLRRALTNLRIDVFGNGQQQRDFNFVDDVSQAFLLAGAHDHLDGKVFNLGHAEHCSLIDFVGILAQHVHVEYRCIEIPPDYAAIELGDYYGDFSKFHEATGWTPQWDLSTGIAATWQYYREHEKHYLEPSFDCDV